MPDLLAPFAGSTPQTSNRQYLRLVRTIVGARVDTTRPGHLPSEALEFHTRTAFKITKTSVGKVANTGKISLFNLSRESRRFLESSRLWVWLQVAYGRTAAFAPWETIFFGDVRKLTLTKSGGDIVTDLDCQTALEALTRSVVTLSFQPGCTNGQVLSAVVEQLRVAVAGNVELPLKIERHGYSGCLLASDVLTKLCDRVGYVWRITDGELQISPKGWTAPGLEIQLNENTGLLGVPTKIEKRPSMLPETNAYQIHGLTSSHVSGRCLLNPKIRPGVLLNVSLDGGREQVRCVVETVDLAGDSHEGIFECQFEGTIK